MSRHRPATGRNTGIFIDRMALCLEPLVSLDPPGTAAYTGIYGYQTALFHIKPAFFVGLPAVPAVAAQGLAFVFIGQAGFFEGKNICHADCCLCPGHAECAYEN
jgi:hypothetical protein